MNHTTLPFVILLAEDEPADAHLLRLALTESGMVANLQHVVDGREALAEEIMSASNVVLGFGSTSKGKGGMELDGKVKKALVEGPVVSVLFTSFIIQ